MPKQILISLSLQPTSVPSPPLNLDNVGVNIVNNFLHFIPSNSTIDAAEKWKDTNDTKHTQTNKILNNK